MSVPPEPTAHPLAAGTTVRALDFPPAMFAFDNSTTAANLNITSTSWALGSPEVAVRFLAPTSGRVGVSLGATVRNNSAVVDRVFVGFRIMEGDPASGNTFQPVSAKYGRSNYAYADADDDGESGSQFTMVSGLTPGTYYYAQVQFRVTVGGGTADVLSRSILVIPLP